MVAESVIADTLTVEVKGETFVFRVPSPREMAQLGTRAAVYRRQDGNGFGDETGLDPLSFDLYRAFALMELLLVRADAKDNWPFSEDDTGKPVVDHKKFPVRAARLLGEVHQKFNFGLDTFLSAGIQAASAS